MPIFIIGVIFIFFSKKPIKIKILATLLPVILWIPVTGLIYHFAGKTIPATFLITKNFNGQFRVIYGEPCGIEPKTLNGRRVLEIPSNGILIIKPELEGGWNDYEYFLIDTNGSLTKLKDLTTFKDDREKIGVYLDGTGSIGGQMPDGSSSSESPLAIEFSDFVVFTGATTFDNYRNTLVIDSLTSVLVDSCRNSKK